MAVPAAKVGKTKPTVKKRPPVQLINAADVEPEEMTFLWLDRIPNGTLTVIGGKPGMGKSLYTNYLAAEVTKAGGAVLMSAPEDALTWVKIPRLMAAGADPRLVHFWPGKLRLPEDVDAAEELIRFHGIKLLLIDPIAKHVTRKGDPAPALEPLVAMAERTGVAVVAVHHLNKKLPKDAHPQDAFGGPAGGWIGTARMAHVLGPITSGDEEQRFMSVAKSNHLRDDAPSVEFYIEEVEVDLPNGSTVEVPRLVFVTADSPVKAGAVVHYKPGDNSGSDTAQGEKKRIGMEFLTLVLVGGPIPAKLLYDQAQKVGVSKKTLNRAADELEVIRQRVGFGPGSHIEWSLPPDHPALRSVGPVAAAPSSEQDLEDALAQILAEGMGGEDDDA
jgi:hypothetical protein